MARALNPTQQKLAERLTILNDRGMGMLTRVYNIKKACGDAKSKPAFLSDKGLEGAIKLIVKKFPIMEIKSHSKELAPVNLIKADVIKALSLYYYTFVDLLDFKDHVVELLTTIDACQCKFDITVNYDLTKNYLDLVATYSSLMILLSKVDDRKAVLGLFNHAHEMMHGSGDPAFPRLGQMIVDYDPPLKKMCEEFVPHAKLVVQALLSLQYVYPRRNLHAEEWRKAQLLSLVTTSATLLNPAQSPTIPCEYLSLDTMERWIVLGFLLCHQHLNQQVAMDLFKMVCQSSWVLMLYRDEVIKIHSFATSFFENIKGYRKKVEEIKECYNHALQHAHLLHRERRKFLRTALKELALVFTDQPGLLGPKSLYVFMGMAFARDEVHWLVRHQDSLATLKDKRPKPDLEDRLLPELLFHVEELRALVRKYNQVLQRYYVQYLSGYDASRLNHLTQNMSVLPEDESILLSSFYSTMTGLSVKQVEDNELFDFRGLRLDWFRLQAYTSVQRSPLQLTDHKELAHLMNTISFHTKMVDFLDEMLNETSDMSFFCFYYKQFEHQFQMCLEFPAQTRYAVAFPLMCSHFMNCTHELCPEERHHIGDRSLSCVNNFLDEMAKEAKQIITNICVEQCDLSHQLRPKNCAAEIAQQVNKRRRENRPGRGNAKGNLEEEKPGVESKRKTREEFTKMDKLHMALTELCYAINYCSTISIWEHTFAPREYLSQHLESRFAKSLVTMVMHNPETNEIGKPTELLQSVRAYMNVLQSLENYVHIDITRVFNNVLLQQTQPLDSHGEKTITFLYANWYLEVLLRRVSAGHIVFSPFHKAFVSLSTEGSLPFSAEEFSDLNELRALAELIGPYGMKYLSENLMWHISSQVGELKKIVQQNRETLSEIRESFDKPDVMKDLIRQLQNVDSVLQRTTIIGVILCFRSLAQEALQDVLDKRIPFLMTSVKDFQQHMPNTQDSAIANIRSQVGIDIVNEMASAAGLSCDVDPALCSAMRNQAKDSNPDDEYTIACLLMVFIAVSIPRLARVDNSQYKPSLEAHANNAHCLAKAVNALAAALFTVSGQGDIEERLKEFLALASSSLLKLGLETLDKDAIRHRESIYILLDTIVQESPFLTMDLLESCFPYVLLRNAYHAVYRQGGMAG